MARLTKRREDGTAWYNRTTEREIVNGDILERLAYYEDLQEAGRLLILPEGFSKGNLFTVLGNSADCCPHYVGLKKPDGCPGGISCGNCWEAALKGEQP